MPGFGGAGVSNGEDAKELYLSEPKVSEPSEDAADGSAGNVFRNVAGKLPETIARG